MQRNQRNDVRLLVRVHCGWEHDDGDTGNDGANNLQQRYMYDGSGRSYVSSALFVSGWTLLVFVKKEDVRKEQRERQ